MTGDKLKEIGFPANSEFDRLLPDRFGGDATKQFPENSWLTDIHCFNPECDSDAITEFVEDGEKIFWFCPECAIEGVISDWQGTRWDNIHRLSSKEKQLLEDFFNESLSDKDKREFIERAATDRDFVKAFIRKLSENENNIE